jgi:hypothetical protein
MLAYFAWRKNDEVRKSFMTSKPVETGGRISERPNE